MAGDLTDWMVVSRLGLAAVLSAFLGLEREFRGQVAGFRTHILVATGSCLFTLVGAFGFQDSHLLEDGGTGRADVTRVASQVVVGIGFLGGGAILHAHSKVRGLTTAANLWVAAALGLACGAGFYLGAVVTTVISLLVLAGLKPLESRIRSTRRVKSRRELIEADVTSDDEHPKRGRSRGTQTRRPDA